MMATICKSCKTVHYVIVSLCRWCGSQCIETKFVDNNYVWPAANREVLSDKPNLSLFGKEVEGTTIRIVDEVDASFTKEQYDAISNRNK